jgi:large subunit ribosomal protein L9
VTIKVNVARSPEEADLQAQGIDVMQQMFERDAAPAPEELSPEPEADATEEADADTVADAEVDTAAEAPAADADAPEADAADETSAAEDGEQA